MRKIKTNINLDASSTFFAQVEAVEPEKKKRKIKEVSPEWDLINKQKPLW